jgi:hypothetical protein
MQKMYLYIPINQLHWGGKTVHTEEVPIYLLCVIDRLVYIGTSSVYTILPTLFN